MVVADTPRKDAVNGAFEEDAFDDVVDFLSLPHAASISVAASRTATADRTRNIVPPTRVVRSTGAELLFDTTHWRSGLQ
jgi:hypothetical protein